MSKNLIVILYFSLAGVAVTLAALVAILAPEQFEKTFQGLLQVLGLASTAAVTIYLLGKQSTTLEEVKTQTNGNLTAMREQLAEKDRQLADKDRQLLQVVHSAAPAQQD